MEDKEIIRKIKQLKTIKPDEEWVVFAKGKILERQRENLSARRRWDWLFTPVERPVLVFAFRGAIAAMIILAGAFFYIYSIGTQAPKVSLSNSFLQNNSLTASLTQIRKNIEKIDGSLKTLKTSVNRKEALAVSNVIRETMDNSRRTIEAIEKTSVPRQVYASLKEVKNALENLSKTSKNIQKEMIEQEINYLKERSLAKEDRARLEKAIKLFKEGKDSEAMMFILKITERK